MDVAADLTRLSPEQLRILAADLQAQVHHRDALLAARQQQLDRRDEAIRRYRIREEKMSHEIALL